MAVAFTELTSAADSADRSTYTTASVTLTAGRLYLLGFAHAKSSSVVAPTAVQTTGAAQAFTVVTGTALTGAQYYCSVWRCIPGSNVTDTIAVSVASGINGQWNLVEVTGMNTSGTNGSGAIVQSKTNIASTTNVTTTLDNDLVSGNARYTFDVGNSSQATNNTVASGTWTSGTNRNGTPPDMTSRGAWNASPATTDKSSTWTCVSATRIGAVILEVAVAAAPGGGETEFLGDIPG